MSLHNPFLPLALALTVACGSSLPPPFVAERDRALAEYDRGHYRAAAQHWQEAARLAPDQRERDEATFRGAVSLERAGERADAEALYEQLERGHGERAARATFARAESLISRGEEAKGYELLRRAVWRFPSSGLARAGATRVLDQVLSTQGPAAERAELERFLQKTAGSELEESLLFRRARWLEKNGQANAAKAAYLELARRFPFPRGVFWDDALLGAARIDEAAGRPREAVQRLEQLLGSREQASVTGSYERSSYAEARFHIAEIYRDALDDPRRARSEFRRVWNDHPTSRLGDDALFEEALLALAGRDAAGACEVARLLLGKNAESRYARCAGALCNGLEKRDCRSAIERRIERAAQGDARPAEPSPDDYSSSSR